MRMNQCMTQCKCMNQSKRMNQRTNKGESEEKGPAELGGLKRRHQIRNDGCRAGHIRREVVVIHGLRGVSKGGSESLMIN